MRRGVSDHTHLHACTRHQEELNKMQETQPEFFDFLRKNDPKLLAFAQGGGGSDSDGEGDESDGEEGGQDEEGDDSDDGETKEQVILTAKLLDRLLARAFDDKKGSWRGVVKVLQAFRAACHLGDEADEKQSRAARNSAYKYRIVRGDVFSDTITNVLQHLHGALSKQVRPKLKPNGEPVSKHFQPAKCTGWARASAPMKAFHAAFLCALAVRGGIVFRARG